MITIENFRNDIRNWLIPLGYNPICSLNHPRPDLDKVHFIKDGVRIILIHENGKIYSESTYEQFTKYGFIHYHSKMIQINDKNDLDIALINHGTLCRESIKLHEFIHGESNKEKFLKLVSDEKTDTIERAKERLNKKKSKWTKILLDKDNRMWRIGFGKNNGSWFFRIDIGSVGFRYKPKY